jgi:DNA-binding CsgD family transcriptional regulator
LALGVLELSLDRPREALEHCRAATAEARAKAIEEPAQYVWFPIHAEAAIACGELEEAEELLDWIEERAVRLDRAWALACGARCRGLLAAARGDEDGAAAAFERALTEHGRVQYRRFDLARTLLAQGETLRRFKKKRAAREAIEAAIAIFDELGAKLWSAKANRELARVSGRTRSNGLTETERRVTELVAAGRANKEIANELFMTVRTVETHLTHVYAKLGVHSRTELVNRLSA